jgi:hypothetical protein
MRRELYRRGADLIIAAGVAAVVAGYAVFAVFCLGVSF